MTEQELKYQDLKREYEKLKEENKRIRFSNGLLEKELQQYRDLEEQGLLLKLPCKEGDTVYKLWYSNGIPYRIQELKIRTLENVVSIVKHNLLGERVFLTKEEAEQKLKELQEKEI